MSSDEFADLLSANVRYARSSPKGFDGIAHAGVLMVTCMDSRLEPLEMIGLRIGEAKIIRTPGAFVTNYAVTGCILGVHMLNVDRILVVPHTHCAMAGPRDVVLAKAKAATGTDLSELPLSENLDQLEKLRADVAKLCNHPLLNAVTIGGFLYDVETGLLRYEC